MRKDFAERPMVQLALREKFSPAEIAIELGIVLGLFGLMVVIGPFGTFADLNVGERAIYWAFMVIVNWLQLRGTQWLLAMAFGWEKFWLITIGACLLASFPASLEVLWIEGLLRPELRGEINILTLYPQVLTVSLAAMVPLSFYFLRVKPMTAKAHSSATGLPAGDAFLRRIPMALGRDLHALQAEDHYVRVYTAEGDDLVLHRFSDAIVELQGLNGLQVHRSWWVAETGIADTARRERKVFLMLKNGMEVPVSRTYMPAVKDKGWLA
jgi:hypothetical protein